MNPTRTGVLVGLPSAWRTPGGQPPPLLLYIQGQGHINCSLPCAVPPPQFTSPVIVSWCCGEALRRSYNQHHHHAVVLKKLALDTLLEQESEGRHRDERVQNSGAPYVRCLISQNEKKFDYNNDVVKRFRFRPTRVHGHTLPLSFLCIS